MSKVVIFGGTGFAGSHIAREAVRREWEVVAVSRHAPAEPLADATYTQANLADTEDVAHLVQSADVVLVALRAAEPVGGTTLARTIPTLASFVASNQARLGVIGGAGSALVAPDGPRLLDTPDFPDAYQPEATAHAAVLEALRTQPAEADWFYVSPAAEFGAEAGIAPRGTYRIGGDVLVTAEDGSSQLAGSDLADAVLDEMETPAHHRERFTVGY